MRCLVRIQVSLFLLLTSLTVAQADWPQFRGGKLAGVASGNHLPDTWSTTKNVAWKIEIPGSGWSSPVVWGDKIFLTSCVGSGKGGAPKTGYYAPGQVQTPEGEFRWTVFCIDAQSGKILWERVAHQGRLDYTTHVKNGYASETPITDGERVYAYFGNVGLFCYDLSGKALWSKKWSVVPTKLGWGTGASPVLHQDRIYLVNDNERQSFLVALDNKTGREVWRVERDEKSSWATPFVWENNLRTEIITSAPTRVRSYNLSGKLLWELGGMSSICIPQPVTGHGLLFVSSGYEFARPRPVYAIRPGASGDISLKEGETSNQHIAWYKEPAGAYHPSPLVLGDHVYVLYSRGLISCFDARTGKELYDKQRLGGTFTASPWSHDGKIFCLSEEGITHVIQAGPEFKILGTNDLEEMCLATPAIAQDSLYVRTFSKLYRIRNAKGGAASAAIPTGSVSEPATQAETGKVSPERLGLNDFTPGRTPTREEVAAIEKEVAANPEDFKLVRKLGIGYFYRVLGAREAEAAPKAQKTLARALELQKDDALTIAFQALLAAVAGKDLPDLRGRADELVKKALELEPNNVGVLSVVAGVYNVGNPDPEKAIEITERIRKLLGAEFKNWSSHGQERILLTQGRAYASAGRLKEAQACFEDGLAVNRALFQAELDKLATKVPALFFSDLTSGPKTGNSDISLGQTANQHGAIVTVWGNKLGTTPGTVTINGATVPGSLIYFWGNAVQPYCVANLYNSHGMQVVIFQVPSTATSGAGTIHVSVGGTKSNTLPFTVRAGRIFFIDRKGNNTNAGTYQSPWHDQTILTGSGKLKPGDITYMRGGVYTELDSSTLFLLRPYDTESGTAGFPMAVTAYPGEIPTLGDATKDYRINANAQSNHWTFAKLRLRGTNKAFEYCGGTGKRFVGNEAGDFTKDIYGPFDLENCTDCQVIGNHIYNGGVAGQKLAHLIYYGGKGVASKIEIAWNHVHDALGGRGIQTRIKSTAAKVKPKSTGVRGARSLTAAGPCLRTAGRRLSRFFLGFSRRAAAKPN